VVSADDLHHVALILGTIREADLGGSGDHVLLLSQGTQQAGLSMGQATSPAAVQGVRMLLHRTGRAPSPPPAATAALTAPGGSLRLSQLGQLFLQPPQEVEPGLRFLLI